MQVDLVPVDSIRPDPGQPRKFFSDKLVQEMGKSILTEGIINPIEVDGDNMIVTGETRWRAAKAAGLMEVPVKVVDPGKTRFLRQVIENVHHNTMTAMETAEAIHKLLGERGYDSSGRGQLESGRGGDSRSPSAHKNDELVRGLANELGKSESFIYQHLGYLQESEEVKEALSTNKVDKSLIREANKFVPEPFRDQVKQRIVEGKIDTNRAVIEVGRALERSPEMADKILSVDLPALKKKYVEEGKRLTDAQVSVEMAKIAPQEKTPHDIAEKIIRDMGFMMDHLKPGFLTSLPSPLALILTHHIQRLVKQLEPFAAKEETVLDGEILEEKV